MWSSCSSWSFQNWRAEQKWETKMSPARQHDYANVTGSSQFPLPFCGTRWIKDEQVAV